MKQWSTIWKDARNQAIVEFLIQAAEDAKTKKKKKRPKPKRQGVR